MELEQVFINLKNSREVIAQFVDRNAKIWSLRNYAVTYNRESFYNRIGVIAALAIIVILGQKGGVDRNFQTIIILAPLAFILIRFVIGKAIDSQKRKEIIKNSEPEIRALSIEMDELVDELNSFTILPQKYRTLHAVDCLGNYIIDRRISSLQEGINLYEDELFRNQQLQNQQTQISQNNHMIQQNNKMMEQNKKMIRAVRSI